MKCSALFMFCILSNGIQISSSLNWICLLYFHWCYFYIRIWIWCILICTEWRPFPHWENQLLEHCVALYDMSIMMPMIFFTGMYEWLTELYCYIFTMWLLQLNSVDMVNYWVDMPKGKSHGKYSWVSTA